MRFVCFVVFGVASFCWPGQLEEAALLAQSKACQSDGDAGTVAKRSEAKRSEAKPSQAPYRHELKRGSCSVGSRLCWVDWLPSVFLTVFWPGTATTTTTTTTATGSQVVCCSAHLFDHLLGQWQRVNLCSGNHCDSDTADYRWTRDTKTKQGRHESDADRGKLDYASELYFLPSMHSFLAPSLHFL